ncbi:hypothetical protein C5167_045050 [Papaver somniferum]|uniref:Enhancer of polycomb-like protein n=1 Tax=Papaver somniferum TaxID=3469 RepID=A0A4Y7LDK5_PAPSO|nr:uncharacterized protein LOC113323030 [Papaver somniferum]RZC82265.1 hypothetical protein C5167_045050 [Papaver somniferum]
MPSVGMIRSTRVFVPKSPSSSSSSVRSSKKLKIRRIKEDNSAGDWLNQRLNNFTSNNKVVVLNHQYESIMMEFNKETQSIEKEIAVKKEPVLISDTEFVQSKRFGNVYSRKRRKLLNGGMEVVVQRNEERMFGKQFVRRQSKGRANLGLKELNSSSSPLKEVELVVIGDSEENSLPPPVKESVDKRVVLSFLIDPTTATTLLSSGSQFLNSILRYMWMKKNSRLRLSLLAAFMNDRTISRVFSAHAGIHLLQDSLPSSSSSSGICRIQRVRNNVPIFSVDFSAIPISFIRLHLAMSLECQRLPHCVQILLNGNVGSGKSLKKKRKVVEITGGNVLCLSSPVNKRICSRKFIVNPLSTVFYSDILNSDERFFASSEDWVSTAVSNCEPRQNQRKSPLICQLNTEADLIPGNDWTPLVHEPKHKKMKLSKDPTYDPDTEADLFITGNDWTPRVHEPKHKKKKLSKDPTYNPYSELEGAALDSENKIDMPSCSASVLVLESDRCYRREEATVMLEYSPSKEWVLVIKEKDLVLYSYKPTDLPWSSMSKTNRFNLAMIWTGSNGWNLEFPDREDWYTFKKLHLECIRRNSEADLEKATPVPTVREVPALAQPIPVPIFRAVPDYVNCDYVPFVQPGVYITREDDRFTRYDADSADEEWLGKVNNNRYREYNVSLEKFEELIEAFEKAVFYSLNNRIDESRAVALCSDTGQNLAVDVYRYWLKRRKQKRASPLIVFQGRPTKKVLSALNRPVLRKKRSIKKKRELPPRGARKLFFHDFDPEFDPVKEKEGEARRIKNQKEDEARRIKNQKEDEARRIKNQKEDEARRIQKQKEDEARGIQKQKEDEARGIQKQKEDEARRIQKQKEDEALRLQKEQERVVQEEKVRKAREDDLRKSEDADILRVEQATKAAQEKLELALQKRQRAQTLMGYADLAAEWATMAMKIAEAARISGSSETAASSYLDD